MNDFERTPSDYNPLNDSIPLHSEDDWVKNAHDSTRDFLSDYWLFIVGAIIVCAIFCCFVSGICRKTTDSSINEEGIDWELPQSHLGISSRDLKNRNRGDHVSPTLSLIEPEIDIGYDISSKDDAPHSSSRTLHVGNVADDELPDLPPGGIKVEQTQPIQATQPIRTAGSPIALEIYMKEQERTTKAMKQIIEHLAAKDIENEKRIKDLEEFAEEKKPKIMDHHDLLDQIMIINRSGDLFPRRILRKPSEIQVDCDDSASDQC